MPSNYENMALISTTNNEWPQSYNQVDEKEMNQMALTGKISMEKPSTGSVQEQQQQQQQALKCPRCDSSNTKFCYYNNYSLTQPRHFCKACKRYWTRGGTLRNVPVGGFCRKNKRIKKTSPSSSSSIPHTTSNTTNHINSLFYGLLNNPSEVSPLQFSGYDGLGFSSSGVVLNEDYRNGFASNSLLSGYGSMFGSSPSITSTTTNVTTPSMASIIASTLQQQQKYMIQGGDGCEKTSFPFESVQMGSTYNGGDGVKVEGHGNRYGWSGSSQNHQIQQFGLSSDNNPSLYWNNTNWTDLTNIGSSVTSLI